MRLRVGSRALAARADGEGSNGAGANFYFHETGNIFSLAALRPHTGEHVQHCQLERLGP